MTASGATMDQATDPETIRRILHERALLLARPPQEEEQSEAVSLMVVSLGAELYGIDILSVREVKPLTDLTPVPNTPPTWAGVINLRGSLFPVLDLRRYLALPETERPAEPKVVVVSSSGYTAGLFVDDVPEVRRVALADILPPLSEGAGTRHQSLRGVTDDLLNVLDIEALLADPSLVVKDEIT